MSYQAEGLTEALGSAVGLDERRVRGDLQRFKELIESRGAESGAWRGEVSAALDSPDSAVAQRDAPGKAITRSLRKSPQNGKAHSPA
jgi:hypothetical protein